MINRDFNINYSQQTCSLRKDYQRVLGLYNCKQLIKDPTRVTDLCSTLIDHIICNNEDKICQCGIIHMGLSDHFLIYCTRKVTRGFSGYHNVVKIRSLRNYNAEDFLLRLSDADWSDVYSSDMDHSSEHFMSTFLQVLDSEAPIR